MRESLPTRRDLGLTKREEAVFDSISFRKESDVLQQAKRYWESLSTFRKVCDRCRDYTYGKQWDDWITDPKTGRRIQEKDLLMREGRVPLKNNVIRQLVKSVKGSYLASPTDPVVVASDRNEQSLGEMMTIVMKYAYTNNKLDELDSKSLEEFTINGACFNKVRYGWKEGKQDVWVESVNHHRVFFNDDMTDPRGWDLKMIGEIHDMPVMDVVSRFAKGDKWNAQRIIDLYRNVSSDIGENAYKNLTSDDLDSISFLVPIKSNLCRVIEVWSKESKERLKCHDTLHGTYTKREIHEYDSIVRENEARINKYVAQGVDMTNIPLIEVEWFVDTYWYARYLTPMGDVLDEYESPYWHESHPYSFKLYPLIDGEVHSFVNDVIDQQRYVNRLITMVDFIMGASAKGVLLFPEDQIPDGMTIEEVADQWVRYNGLILFKPKAGYPMPQQISTNATNVGAYDLLNLQLRLLQDISGVHGALQGRTASSGTPAAQYAQEVEQSASNLTDMFHAFKSFREDRDTKVMKTIQQYYSDNRYINIAGNTFSEEAKVYNPERVKNTEFDLSISESSSTPAFRSAQNDLLMQLFQAGAINIKEMLENGAFPFADRLLQSIAQREEEMLAAQQSQGQIVPPEVMQQINEGSSPSVAGMG